MESGGVVVSGVSEVADVVVESEVAGVLEVPEDAGRLRELGVEGF